MLENTFETRQYFFSKPVRAIFSGSSESGKSFLIGKILEKQLQIFGEKWSYIAYFFPRMLSAAPVEYEKLTDVPLSYFPGFPERNFVESLPRNSLLIIDDQGTGLSTFVFYFFMFVKDKFISQYPTISLGSGKIGVDKHAVQSHQREERYFSHLCPTKFLLQREICSRDPQLEQLFRAFS